MSENGHCPNCKADFDGGSIWETGYELALTTGGDTWPNAPAISREEAEQRADKYASLYGATRTKGRWGRQIGIYDMDRDRTVSWQCPDCEHIWDR